MREGETVLCRDGRQETGDRETDREYRGLETTLGRFSKKGHIVLVLSVGRGGRRGGGLSTGLWFQGQNLMFELHT